MPGILISAEGTAENMSKVFCPHVAYIPVREDRLYLYKIFSNYIIK